MNAAALSATARSIASYFCSASRLAASSSDFNADTKVSCSARIPRISFRKAATTSLSGVPVTSDKESKVACNLALLNTNVAVKTPFSPAGAYERGTTSSENFNVRRVDESCVPFNTNVPLVTTALSRGAASASPYGYR